jgi:integration host factor subunit alpha
MRDEAHQLVAAMLTEILEALSRGENVKLSTFGTFVVRSKRERVGRNPKSKVEVSISARRAVVFKASRVLGARINTRRPLDERLSA